MPARLANLTAMTHLATELHVQLHSHLLEHISDRLDNPVGLLVQSGALNLGPHLIGAHGIHLTDDEVALLARKGVRLIHCPLSNMRLASGVMRLPDLHRAGIMVGLGLDGGTNDTSDVFSNMRAAIGLQRAVSLKADGFPTVPDVLRMATIGGADLLDQADHIGSLTPGKKADLIILNPHRVNFAPRLD